MSTEKRLVFAKRMFRPRSSTGHAIVGAFHLGDGSDRALNTGPRGASQGSNKIRPYGRAVRGRDMRILSTSFAPMTNGEILPPEALLAETPPPVVRTKVVVRVSKKPDPSEVLALRQVGKDKVEAVDGSGAKKKPSDLPKEIVVDLAKAYGHSKTVSVTEEDLDLAAHLEVLSMIPQGLRDARGNLTGLAKSLRAAGVLTKHDALVKAQQLRRGSI